MTSMVTWYRRAGPNICGAIRQSGAMMSSLPPQQLTQLQQNGTKSAAAAGAGNLQIDMTAVEVSHLI